MGGSEGEFLEFFDWFDHLLFDLEGVLTDGAAAVISLPDFEAGGMKNSTTLTTFFVIFSIFVQQVEANYTLPICFLLKMLLAIEFQLCFAVSLEQSFL